MNKFIYLYKAPDPSQHLNNEHGYNQSQRISSINDKAIMLYGYNAVKILQNGYENDNISLKVLNLSQAILCYFIKNGYKFNCLNTKDDGSVTFEFINSNVRISIFIDDCSVTAYETDRSSIKTTIKDLSDIIEFDALLQCFRKR